MADEEDQTEPCALWEQRTAQSDEVKVVDWGTSKSVQGSAGRQHDEERRHRGRR